MNKVAIVNFTGLCSADMYPIRPVEGKSNKVFLWRLLLSSFFIRYTESLPDRANIPKINRKEIALFQFPLPPLELQNKFASIVMQVEQLKEKDRQKLEKLQTLYDALMQRAFNGEIQ